MNIKYLDEADLATLSDDFRGIVIVNGVIIDYTKGKNVFNTPILRSKGDNYEK